MRTSVKAQSEVIPCCPHSVFIHPLIACFSQPCLDSLACVWPPPLRPLSFSPSLSLMCCGSMANHEICRLHSLASYTKVSIQSKYWFSQLRTLWKKKTVVKSSECLPAKLSSSCFSSQHASFLCSHLGPGSGFPSRHITGRSPKWFSSGPDLGASAAFTHPQTSNYTDRGDSLRLRFGKKVVKVSRVYFEWFILGDWNGLNLLLKTFHNTYFKTNGSYRMWKYQIAVFYSAADRRWVQTGSTRG